eukprot:6487236-Amphidinium_carterae.3
MKLLKCLWLPCGVGVVAQGLRYEAWLAGGEVPRVDCGTLRHGQVCSGRDLDGPKAKAAHGQLPVALLSRAGDNRYLYYVAEQMDRDMSAFRGALQPESFLIPLTISDSFLISVAVPSRGWELWVCFLLLSDLRST